MTYPLENEKTEAYRKLSVKFPKTIFQKLLMTKIAMFTYKGCIAGNSRST